MTRPQNVVVLAAIIGLGLSSTGWADGPFNMRSLNPFGKKQESPRSVGSVSDQDSGSVLPKLSMPKVQMPKMEMPQLKMPRFGPEKKANGPGTVQRISQTTQSMFTKTRDTLMPWAKPKAKSVTRSRGITIKPKQKKKSFFGGIFGESPEPKLPETPNEFLSQPQIR